MAEIIRMLALSPTMETGTISAWHVAEGGEVKPGTILCEVETDKANMDYETDTQGNLLKILVGQGEGAGVGDPIAIIGHPGDDIGPLMKEAKKAPSKAAKPEKKAEKPAEEPAEPEEKAEKPTKKPAEESAAKPEEKPSVKPEKEPVEAAAEAEPKPEVSTPEKVTVKASPLARSLAGERGIPLESIKGSGPGGRIVKKDVLAAAETGAAPAARPEAEIPAAGDQEFPVSNMRKIIAARLAESKYSAPHYYITVSIIADEIVNMRRQYNEEHEEAEISLNAILIKLAAEAIRRHPRVNVTWAGDKIIQHGSIDISLAVAVEDGLITPVVRNCGGKGIVRIERELGDLIPRARVLKLKPEEYQDSTFTISNLGMFGVESFTAVINPPGSAIMALGAIARKPVVNDRDEIEIKSVMKATLSCDHRVVDGAIGAAFMKEFKLLVEEPFRVLL